MSLRLRVALFTAAGTSVLMALGALAVLAAVRTDQIASVDSLLAAQYQVLAQPAATAARLNRPRLEELAIEAFGAAVIRVWEGTTLLALEPKTSTVSAAFVVTAPSRGIRTGTGTGRTFEPRLRSAPPVDVAVSSPSLVDAVYDRLPSASRLASFACCSGCPACADRCSRAPLNDSACATERWPARPTWHRVVVICPAEVGSCFVLRCNARTPG